VELDYCWSLLRRRFYVIAVGGNAPFAAAALGRIGELNGATRHAIWPLRRCWRAAAWRPLAAIVAVEETALLGAVERNIRRIKIEDDAPRRRWVGGEVEVEEHLFHRRIVNADLVIAGDALPGRPFQSLQRRFAGEPGDIGALRLERVGEQGEDRIVAQLVVIVDVLIPERLAVDALRTSDSRVCTTLS
jgi:hypothetical protein